MKSPFKDFLNWLKKPNPDTTLVNLWKRKRARDEEKHKARIKQKTTAKEADIESIQREAYFLWEADGKPEGKDEYYWTKACEKIMGEPQARDE